ncbi:uncharacterized protein LOC135844364 [Planococcus citri]|uniref:uncharacterized protein LOC135844364 n=1 Tax=Planococcus citri TaxID=170843 RepID=UPI0031F77505
MKLVYFTFLVVLALATRTAGASVVKDAKGQHDETGLHHSEVKKHVTNATTTTNENAETIRKSLSQKLLESQEDLREYVSSQMDHVYEILKKLANSTDSHKVLAMDLDELPFISDSFYIGKFNKSYKLADMQYTNVKVYGMSGFKNYALSVDKNHKKANVTLVAPQLIIEGNYSLSNFLRHATGSFTVKLLDNVTYTENDLYCKFKNEIDIASSEATITFGKSEYDYRNMGVISIFLEGIISNKLVEEILYRVGKELGHRIRHVVISKVKEITSQKDVSSLGEYNRVSSIMSSSLSQIRTWLNKTVSVKAPLPGIYHKMKVHNNTIIVSNVTLTGLNTTHLKDQIRAYRDQNDFYINMEGQAGPLTIGGRIFMTEVRNGTLEQIPLNADYKITQVRVRIVVSCSLLDDQDSLQVEDLDVSVAQPSLKMQPGKINFKEDDLKQLADFLRPDIEAELYKWLKDFVNDTFKRRKTTTLAPVDVMTHSKNQSLFSQDNSGNFYS